MSDRLLFVTVSPTPSVKLIAWPTGRVSLHGEEFQEVGAGDTNGFYDFLRLPGGHIVGVRFTPFVEHSGILESVADGPGLRVERTEPSGSLELFWSPDRRYSQELSGDQFMDYNYIFRSSAQNFAVTFGFDHLDESEVEDLLSGLPPESPEGV